MKLLQKLKSIFVREEKEGQRSFCTIFGGGCWRETSWDEIVASIFRAIHQLIIISLIALFTFVVVLGIYGDKPALCHYFCEDLPLGQAMPAAFICIVFLILAIFEMQRRRLLLLRLLFPDGSRLVRKPNEDVIQYAVNMIMILNPITFFLTALRIAMTGFILTKLIIGAGDFHFITITLLVILIIFLSSDIILDMYEYIRQRQSVAKGLLVAPPHLLLESNANSSGPKLATGQSGTAVSSSAKPRENAVLVCTLECEKIEPKMKTQK